MKENKKFISERVKRASRITSNVVSYTVSKYFEIMGELGYNLFETRKKNKIYWRIDGYDKKALKYKNIKQGTFKQCMDFILNKWKKK